MTTRLFILLAVLASLLLPSRLWACACCAHPGEYRVDFIKPDAYKLGIIEQMRFGTTAHLFTGEAEPDDATKGLTHPTDNYSLTGSFADKVWKLTFQNGDESGTLSLRVPAKMLRFAADIHDGQTKPGYPEPVLYKEWRFEGDAGGTGCFKAGMTRGTKYSLVFQGRGNSCDNAEDFTHWQLHITGKNAEYTFYGELGAPDSDENNQFKDK
jgi:hypothetical protein